MAVLREEASRGGSSWVHEHLRPGDVIEVDGPRNLFALEPADAFLFIAGGIGITPILPMVRRASSTSADWQLVYLGRRRETMPFLEELIASEGRVTVASREEGERFDLSALFAGVHPGTLVYCCGPASLLDAVAAESGARGLKCVIERFVPVVSAEQAREGAGFEVVCRTSNLTFRVGDGESILEIAERSGLRPPSSCMEGTCGTCETTVVEGVPDHRDGILTDSEREASETMMICVSRSKTPVLVLDL
ncbi:PDR/VanB family oxidoreductase [Microbacterium sp. PMB16]|uniref:PDR/VanB family oxidoreductase n=1 Tax=Microbacterium sp. PMB16 TaxID=3120157 RepID=UPI003F4BDE06